MMELLGKLINLIQVVASAIYAYRLRKSEGLKEATTQELHLIREAKKPVTQSGINKSIDKYLR